MISYKQAVEGQSLSDRLRGGLGHGVCGAGECDGLCGAGDVCVCALHDHVYRSGGGDAVIHAAERRTPGGGAAVEGAFEGGAGDRHDPGSGVDASAVRAGAHLSHKLGLCDGAVHTDRAAAGAVHGPTGAADRVAGGGDLADGAVAAVRGRRLFDQSGRLADAGLRLCVCLSHPVGGQAGGESEHHQAQRHTVRRGRGGGGDRGAAV